MKPGKKRTVRVARLEQRRLEAAQMFAAGARTVEIARKFGVAWRTAFKWRQAFNARGFDGLRSRGLPGREPLLKATQRRRLRAILRAGASKSGYPDDAWTLARVHTVTERTFGLTCSKVSIWRMLRQSKVTAGIAARTAARSTPCADSTCSGPATSAPESA